MKSNDALVSKHQHGTAMPRFSSDSKSTMIKELVLDLRAVEPDLSEGVRPVRAIARFSYNVPQENRRIVSAPFLFTSPFGPIDREELSWYMEKYCHWPESAFRERAQKVEAQLQHWGRSLYDAIAPDSVSALISSWEEHRTDCVRKLTVSVDLLANEKRTTSERVALQKMASALLSIPWELLHNGRNCLLLPPQNVQVRRKLLTLRTREAPLATMAFPLLRILLISPRPEDEHTVYFDHRNSARPVIQALQGKEQYIELTPLAPPTFSALKEELHRAKASGRPYHVVHFDGHGTYDRLSGLGGLYFEHDDDHQILEKRRSRFISSEALAELLSEHQLPFFFLNACKSAQAELVPTAAVATALVNQGVGAVVAMSHAILMETSQRFVKVFYKALISGKQVDGALQEGQSALQREPWRLNVRGAGELHLHDWFVPVLFLNDTVPQLIKSGMLDRTTLKPVSHLSHNELPPPPKHGFIGRSRELLAIERMLLQQTDARAVTLLGEAGVGKTAIAAESARWLTASRRFRHTVFVRLKAQTDARIVLDAIGRQLISGFSLTHGLLQEDEAALPRAALTPVVQFLEEQPTLVVLDEMEVLLSPPVHRNKKRVESSEALREIFQLCQTLLERTQTRILFTSREALPPPFDTPRLEISRFNRTEAAELVSCVLAHQGLQPTGTQSALAARIERFVEIVNGHARSLVLLGPEIGQLEEPFDREVCAGLMSAQHRNSLYARYRRRRTGIPGVTPSLFTHVERSLRRVPAEIQNVIGLLAPFQGGGNLGVMELMLAECHQLSSPDAVSLGRACADALIAVGLAEEIGKGHLRFHPALGPYLMHALHESKREQVNVAWLEGMESLVTVLYEQQVKQGKSVTTLILLELPNLLAAVEQLKEYGDAARIVSVAAELESLLQTARKPDSMNRVRSIRETFVRQLCGWSHIRFKAEVRSIDSDLREGRFRQAVAAARILKEQSEKSGEKAYFEAAYDIAYASWLLGHSLKKSGFYENALSRLREASRRFQVLENWQGAVRMASVAMTGSGACLLALGRLQDAETIYHEAVEASNTQKAFRDAAVAQGQLGAVYMLQHRYQEALEVYQKAREIFERLHEDGPVAAIWRRTGMLYRRSGHPEAAEDAYRKALAIGSRQKDLQGQAASLSELSSLYHSLGRTEEAIAFLRPAIDIAVGRNDLRKEGARRTHLAAILFELRRIEEARQEIQRALECKKTFGHAAEPWRTWNVLAALETHLGHVEAAEDARRNAVCCYTEYRRKGGESQSPLKSLYASAKEALRTGECRELQNQIAERLQNALPPSETKNALLGLQNILNLSKGGQEVAESELSSLDMVELRLLSE